MNERVRPDEAAWALHEIRQRQEQVINETLVPVWFWWAIGGLMIVLSAAVDSGRGLVIGIGTSVFVLGVLAVTGWVVAGSYRRAQVRNDLLGPAGVFAILGFVALVVGVSLPISFAVQAAGVRYPATIGVTVAAGMLVAGGPLLNWFLRRVMLSNRAGSRAGGRAGEAR